MKKAAPKAGLLTCGKLRVSIIYVGKRTCVLGVSAAIRSGDARFMQASMKL